MSAGDWETVREALECAKGCTWDGCLEALSALDRLENEMERLKKDTEDMSDCLTSGHAEPIQKMNCRICSRCRLVLKEQP